jgi:lysophospholipase L1-like esterase
MLLSRPLAQVLLAVLFVASAVVLFRYGVFNLNGLNGNSATEPVPPEGSHYGRHLSINRQVQASKGDVELIFVGDSITERWETTGQRVWQKYYADRNALNLGVGADCTQQVLWRLENGNLEQIRPRAVVLMIGTNNLGVCGNSPQEVIAGIAAIVAKLQEKLPRVKILLLDILPRGQDASELHAEILRVNDSLQDMQDGVEVVYLPIGRFFLTPEGTISPSIMPDFLHLSPAGYEIWAARMEASLAALLGDSPK